MSRISNVTLNQEPEHYTVTIRKTIDFLKEFPQTAEQSFKLTAQYLNELGISPMGGAIVCYYNQNLKACDVEMGWQITQQVEDKGDMICRFVPSRKIVSAIDLGPYKDSDPTMEAVFNWIKEKGIHPQGTIYNYYLNDPNRPETEYLTQIFMPVKEL